MSTLESSIAMKTKATKAPAITGMPAGSPPDSKSVSAGPSITQEKAKKNAASSKVPEVVQPTPRSVGKTINRF